MSSNRTISQVLLDTSPLKGGHAARGIGLYTRELFTALQKQKDISVAKDPNDFESLEYIVHYPYFDLFFSTLPLLSRHKRVVTIHDVIPLKFPEFYKPGNKGRLRFQKQKVALKRVSAVITDSEASKNDIHEYLGVPLEHIAVIYLAANPNLTLDILPSFSKVKKRYGISKRYVLYVGDINYNKNIPQLIKSVKYMPTDVKLVCVGRNFRPQNIPEWHWIETQVALSDVADRVIFVPDILTENNNDLAALYHHAACYIQPSFAEGFGLPVLEAMTMRTPVVATLTTSLPEVGGKHALYAEPEAAQIAEKVLEVLDWNKTTRKNWLDKAENWAHTFSWEKTARETAALYKKVQNNQPITHDICVK